MKNVLLDKGIILPSGEISKDKVNLVTGAITQPFAEMVWVTTGGDMETVNRLTDVLVTMNTPADRGKLFKIIKMLYGLMGLPFSEEAEPTGIQRMLESYAGSGFKPEFAPAPASFVVMLPNRNAGKNQADDLDLSREEKVLRLLTERGSISRKDVEQLLGCSSFPANQVLKLLFEQGRIAKTGAARGTKYILNTRD